MPYVTKEELEYIREEGYQDHCISISRKVDEILSRPDPLALLEAWRDATIFNGKSCVDIWLMEKIFIKRLRENPEAVLDELVKMGVWKE